MCWLEGLYHDHNTTITWKVYSHASVSKVKGAFPLKEPIRFYDMLESMPNVCFYECEPM